MRAGGTIRSLLAQHEKARYPLWVLGFFFLLAMHYFQPNYGGYGLLLPFNVMSWVPLSWLVGLACWKAASESTFRYSSLTAGLTLCILLLLIPSLYPQSVSFWSNTVLLGLLGGFAVFVSLQQFAFQKRHLVALLFLIVVGAWVQAGLGWLEYFGFDKSTFTFSGIAVNQPSGFFRQRNVMASFCATALVLSGFLLAMLASDRKILRWALLLTPLLLVPLIVMLYSRTGWIGAALGFVLVQPLLWKKVRKSDAAIWCAAALFGVLTALFLNTLSGAGQTALGKMDLEGPRAYFYPQTIDMVLERPIAGYGYGQFESSYIEHSAGMYAAGESYRGGMANLAHPHNELLYWWSEGGIIALAALLIAAFLVVRGALRAEDWRFSLALLALLFPITFHSQTEMPFLASVPHWIVFVILIFVVDWYTGKQREKPVPFTLLPRVASVGVPVIVTAFMLTTLHTDRVLFRFESNPRVDISTLENISNPALWQDRLYWDLNFGQMVLGIYQNRPELIEPFIEWAPELIERRPRGLYFQYLVIAHRAVGNEKKAEEVSREAEYLLPHHDFNYTVEGIEQLESWYPGQAHAITVSAGE